MAIRQPYSAPVLDIWVQIVQYAPSCMAQTSVVSLSHQAISNQNEEPAIAAAIIGGGGGGGDNSMVGMTVGIAVVAGVAAIAILALLAASKQKARYELL